MPGKPKLLLVDDNISNHVLTEEILKDNGIDCETHRAFNGLEALHYIVEHGLPDIILLDLSMPVMDGFEFMLKYQAFVSNSDATNTRVYVISNSLADWVIDKFETTGHVTAYLEKPFVTEYIETVFGLRPTG